MVNDMRRLTGNLLVRLLLCEAVTCLSAVIAGVWICTAGSGGVLRLLSVPLLLAAANVPVWLFLFVRPYRMQAEKDREFAENGRITDSYENPWYWTEENRGVIERFRMMTERRKVMELAVESSKVIAMRDQINPHFLYNTLDAIRSDMLISGHVKTADTVEALSRYFAYVASNDEQITSIAEELENVKDYFQIQKYRFGDRLEMEIIDEIGAEELREIGMPRLVLQPLVENAISHGLELSKKTGLITLILRRTEKELELHVTDNGVGMDTETLNRLNDRLRNPAAVPEKKDRKKGGIAMNNVNSRIRLLYGEEYGLHVFSMKDIGTDITVSLPLKRRDETT